MDTAPINEEITGYRSVLRQLLWLGQQSRLICALEGPWLYRKLCKTTLAAVKSLNKLVEFARHTSELGIITLTRKAWHTQRVETKELARRSVGFACDVCLC